MSNCCALECDFDANLHCGLGLMSVDISSTSTSEKQEFVFYCQMTTLEP